MTSTATPANPSPSLPMVVKNVGHAGWVLYTVTFILELIGAFARFTITFIFSEILFFIVRLIMGVYILATGGFNTSFTSSGAQQDGLATFVQFLNFGPAHLASFIFAVVVAFGPLVLSLAAAIGVPGGFGITRLALGARRLSFRELETINQVLADLKTTRPDMRAPAGFFVLNRLEPTIYIIGSTIYITRPLLHEQSQHLNAQLAHALGHINSPDGRLTLALRRFVFPVFYVFSGTFGQLAPGRMMLSALTGTSAEGCLVSGAVALLTILLSLAGGGFGLFLLNFLWVPYWKLRDYEADSFAVTLKQGDGLIAFLETYQRLQVAEQRRRRDPYQIDDIAVPYFVYSQPDTELRLERLYGTAADFYPQLAISVARSATGCLWALVLATVLLFGCNIVGGLVAGFQYGLSGTWIVNYSPNETEQSTMTFKWGNTFEIRTGQDSFSGRLEHQEGEVYRLTFDRLINAKFSSLVGLQGAAVYIDKSDDGSTINIYTVDGGDSIFILTSEELVKEQLRLKEKLIGTWRAASSTQFAPEGTLYTFRGDNQLTYVIPNTTPQQLDYAYDAQQSLLDLYEQGRSGTSWEVSFTDGDRTLTLTLVGCATNDCTLVFTREE